MKKLHLTIIVTVAVALVIGSVVLVLLNDRPPYEVVKVYPHDRAVG